MTQRAAGAATLARPKGCRCRGSPGRAAIAAALALFATPCLAQALDLNPYGLALDPYRVFPPGTPVEVPTMRHRHIARLRRGHHRRPASRHDGA